MAKARILYIVHNHPSVRPGGAELYALELYQAMRSSSEFEPVLLARGEQGPRPGLPFGMVNNDSNQYFFFPGPENYNWFLDTSPDKERYTRDFHSFLSAVRPELVHVQHTLALGLDLLRQIKNTLPKTPIVYTLHDYGHICHRQGQMVRVQNQELCLEESPQRCHQCFPKIAPAEFFLRRRFVRSHLALVDLFVAPSRFLRERYIDWGIPAEKIRFEEYGRLDAGPLESEPLESGDKAAAQPEAKTRFGFFGQCTMFKGVDVLLKAMKLVAEEADRAGANGTPPEAGASNLPLETCRARSKIHLYVHSANLEMQLESFRKEITALLEATKASVTWAGRYHHDQLPRLMAQIDWVVVPSIWWENSPLVIQEAFQHGRPVICSNVGGMAEKVSDGVNGLHFRVGDPASLAQTLHRAAASPGLWHTLRRGIPAVYAMADHMVVLTRAYRELLDQRASRS
jgi:glycosyltransferase involved in cell wall biosynthesis